MRLRSLFILPAALLAFASLAHAASFDCKLAKTPREKTVCATPKLSALDSQLGTVYTAAHSKLSPAAFQQIQSDQISWLKWLDLVCPATASKDSAQGPIADCLTTEYTDRLQQFTDKIKTDSGYHFYPRYQVVYVKGHTAADNPGDPGFGFGAFAWVQIDDPSPAAAAFNNAASTAALKVAGLMSEKKPTDIAHVVLDPTGYTRTYFEVRAANGNLIEIDLGIEGYNWGGAHPDDLFSSFAWLPSAQRPLADTDVFDPATGWKTKLVAPALAKLKSNKDVADMIIAEGSDLTNGIAKTLADPTAWTLSPAGLTLTFEPYAITAFAAGEPTVTFSWAELKPYLAKNFNPAGLPTAKPSQN
jgi:uncharacterized protein